MTFIGYLVVFITAQLVNCQEVNFHLYSSYMGAPGSFSISKDFALKFDQDLGRADEEISEVKRMELENNLIDVAEILHIVPPGVVPRKTLPIESIKNVKDHATSIPSHYALRGTRLQGGSFDVKRQLPPEPAFALSIAYTTSAPKVVGGFGGTFEQLEPTPAPEKVEKFSNPNEHGNNNLSAKSTRHITVELDPANDLEQTKNRSPKFALYSETRFQKHHLSVITA